MVCGLGDWKGVVQLYESHLLSTDRILLWFQPDFQALDFLQRNLNSVSVSGVSSIGTRIFLIYNLLNNPITSLTQVVAPVYSNGSSSSQQVIQTIFTDLNLFRFNSKMCFIVQGYQ